MTSIKYWQNITAVVDDDQRTISLRIRKAGPDDMVTSNEAALKRQAIRELNLGPKIDEGYQLTED